MENKTIPAPPPRTMSSENVIMAEGQAIAKEARELRKENAALRLRIAELESVIGIQ